MSGFFRKLQANVNRMGKPARPVVVDLESPPIRYPEPVANLEVGVVVRLDDLGDASDRGGLLSYNGSQILLYIRELTSNFDRVVSRPDDGPKFHVAECRTLKRMRSENRFQRYVATNDVGGLFKVTDGSSPGARSAKLKLRVCKDCLRHLNYEDYQFNKEGKKRIFEQFSLPTFFSRYSTLFDRLPPEGFMDLPGTMPSIAETHGMSEDFPLDCSSCGITLAAGSRLLVDTGKGGGTASSSINALCIDCRRKPPSDAPIHVDHESMKEIVQARLRHRPVGHMITWEEAFEFADSAYHGLMQIYRRQEHSAPEPGLEIQNTDGSVIFELGLAWSESKHAVVQTGEQANRAREAGWDAMTLAEALLDSREDG